MQKIMFNDQYCLTQAVLEGRKTMTRREEPFLRNLTYTYGQQGMDTRIEVLPFGEVRHYRKDSDSFIVIGKSRFQVGEVVSVAQRYKDIDYNQWQWINGDHMGISVKYAMTLPGWNNKMFTKASLMPHQIRITDIKVERLQDISDEDCLLEGIYEDYEEHGGMYTTPFYDYKGNDGDGFYTPREAFASLIDKVSGKDTWERNPWVFAYSFELACASFAQRQ